jgi:deazaflavin-dependent oxidoreductase (nitroreductase family)
MPSSDAERPARTDIRVTNKAVIAAYRERGGNEPGSVTPLVILTTRGRVSGKDHVTPVAVVQDGGRLVVAGSMGGLPRNPQWYENLLADPIITVEYEGETYRARATTVPDGPERDRLFTLMNQVIPDLHNYQERARATRQIPIVVLDRET